MFPGPCPVWFFNETGAYKMTVVRAKVGRFANLVGHLFTRPLRYTVHYHVTYVRLSPNYSERQAQITFNTNSPRPPPKKKKKRNRQKCCRNFLTENDFRLTCNGQLRCFLFNLASFINKTTLHHQAIHVT